MDYEQDAVLEQSVENYVGSALDAQCLCRWDVSGQLQKQQKRSFVFKMRYPGFYVSCGIGRRMVSRDIIKNIFVHDSSDTHVSERRRVFFFRTLVRTNSYSAYYLVWQIASQMYR